MVRPNKKVRKITREMAGRMGKAIAKMVKLRKTVKGKSKKQIVRE